MKPGFRKELKISMWGHAWTHNAYGSRGGKLVTYLMITETTEVPLELKAIYGGKGIANPWGTMTVIKKRPVQCLLMHRRPVGVDAPATLAAIMLGWDGARK